MARFLCVWIIQSRGSGFIFCFRPNPVDYKYIISITFVFQATSVWVLKVLVYEFLRSSNRNKSLVSVSFNKCDEHSNHACGVHSNDTSISSCKKIRPLYYMVSKPNFAKPGCITNALWCSIQLGRSPLTYVQTDPNGCNVSPRLNGL